MSFSIRLAASLKPTGIPPVLSRTSPAISRKASTLLRSGKVAGEIADGRSRVRADVGPADALPLQHLLELGLASGDGVLATLANLVRATTREEVRDALVVIMLDASVSMSLEDHFPDGRSIRDLATTTELDPEDVSDVARLELVKRALSRDGAAVLRALGEHHRLKV